MERNFGTNSDFTRSSCSVSMNPNGRRKQNALTCSGHTRPVVEVHFSQLCMDGSYFLISACKDGIPIIRNGISGDWLGSLEGHKGAVWSAKLSDDATLAVTGSADFTVKLWDTANSAAIATLQHSHVVKSVYISPDKRYIASGGMEKKVRIFDTWRPDCEPIRILEGNEGEIKNVLMDSERGLVFHTDGNQMRVWDLRSSTLVGCRNMGSNITELKFSYDHRYILGTAGKTVNFWNAETSILENSITAEVDLASASLHPTHPLVLVGGINDLWVRVHDYRTGQRQELYKGHHGPIHSVSYSPDGALYATGSEDGTLRLWQTWPGMVYGLWGGIQS